MGKTLENPDLQPSSAVVNFNKTEKEFIMPLLDWKSEYSVGITEIDLQHKKLIAMLNDLHEAMGSGKGKETLSKIVKGLMDYTQSHFATEEKYFKQFSYPKTASHVMEHKKFVQEVSDFAKKYEEGKLTLSIEIMKFLKTWLTTHICGVDKEYAPFLKEKGLK